MDTHVSTPWPWTVVLPIKGGPTAKTRLSSLGNRRAAVAAALARDSLAAVVGSSRLSLAIVVTADPTVRAMAESFGAAVTADPGTGLDAAVRAALAEAPTYRPCAVLLADVPAVRPGDISRALDACAEVLACGAGRAVVPDADGDGTVLIAAAHPAGLHPQFGPGSAARHASGGVLLDIALPRLRRDVDTPQDLADALLLGVGKATSDAVDVPATCDRTC